jgi:hypothetical protein
MRCKGGVALLVLLSLGVGGCVTGQSGLARQTEAATAACRAQALTSYVARAKCLNDAANIARPTSRNPDLFDLETASRLEIAIRVDKKEITPEQGALEYAKLEAQLTSEAQSRNLANRSVAAQEQVANAASAPVTCIHSGSVTNCF